MNPNGDDPLAAPSSSVVRDAKKQKRSTNVVLTETTELQETTEQECQPFFVDLKSLRKNSQDHLRDTGLLPPDQADEHDLEICLIRDKHYNYLSRVFRPDRQPLGRNLVALDSSRPWMMYWTLHGCDLLLVQQPDGEGAPPSSTNLLLQEVGDPALCAVVSTIEACWQSMQAIALPQHLNLSEHDRSLLVEASNEDATFQGGGFGGGPGQMAHAATTYAAVLTLCIVATSGGSTSSNMAWALLERIRKPLYAWFLSLQQPKGGFRMHHDGEIDVRASYTVFCVAKLLHLLTPTLASQTTIDFVASCQTYEGGFGGEPFTEAHGGYAYCAVAALQLANQMGAIDRSALLGWLARRQMGYEGGFSGRANKLVDGCYSFWQGGAMAIVSSHYGTTSSHVDGDGDEIMSHLGGRGDIWLPTSDGDGNVKEPASYALLFDKPMLQRYILLCAQDVNGGLRDKPSKPRDFYHSCYNLSGLSLSQHSGQAGASTTDYNQHSFGHPVQSRVAASHPCYNIRLERVSQVLDHFKD